MTLDLFGQTHQNNILPYDGVVQNFGKILTPTQSETYLRYFLTHFPWVNDEVFLFGRHIKTERKVVWFGDEQFQYIYSGMPKIAQPWDAGLYRLKTHIEHVVGHTFNSCLANLYEHGQQGMGWHSDNESSLLSTAGLETIIASLSFGAPRKFVLKHQQTQEKVEMILESGRLIVMRGDTQKYWKHALMKSKRILEPRINLTFRYFYN